MPVKETPRSRTVLVTGASSGIGEATARLLAEQGFTVGIVARRGSRLRRVIQDCKRCSSGSQMWVADLSDPQAAAELALSVWDELGGLDVLVNNAAAPMRRHVAKLTLAEVERTMAINYFSPVAMTLAILPRMLARSSGTIVNVSSLGGRLGIANEAAYSASKFALCGWSESMAVDLSGTGVRVRLILPGAVDTEIWNQPGNDPPLYNGPKVAASEVAAGILSAIESNHFEHYLPDMKAIVEMKTSDIDAFMQGMTALGHERSDVSKENANVDENRIEGLTAKEHHR